MLTTFSGRRASQNERELSDLIHMFKVEGVRSYLEIGAREGDTFYDIVSSLPPGSKAMAVDLPGGMWGKNTTGRKLKSACQALQAKGYDALYMLADSTKQDVIVSVGVRGPWDAVLIDGDHRYEGAKADWLNYGQTPRLVAFHDIVGDGQRERVHGNEVEVPRLWSEIKADGAHWVEFVDEGSQMGIGVVRHV